jgi:hypothetical protein
MTDFDAWTARELDRLDAARLKSPLWPRFGPGKLLDYVLWRRRDLIRRDGLWLEFGVHKGSTINRIAKAAPGLVHGFDSFEGLPEDWNRGRQISRKGAFDLGGALPKVRANVRLHKGWFEETLPPFLAETPGDVAFLHVDCDLYSSTKTVFEALGDRIGPGTVMVFDELINYATFREHEWRALYELVRETGLAFDWIGTFGGVRRDFDGYMGFARERADHGRDPEAALIIV